MKGILGMGNLETLTAKQREIYDFIRTQIRSRGYGPTVREIGGAFGISSPNGVMCHLKALEKKGLIIREENKSRAIQLVDNPLTSNGLPLLGRIAAGPLNAAVEDSERIDFTELFNAPERFVLEVRGDSMIEDHIADGDYVVVNKQATAGRGDIVVALTEENETTLKRWFPESGRIRLQPANATMEPIYVKDAQVIGVVVGLVRNKMK